MRCNTKGLAVLVAAQTLNPVFGQQKIAGGYPTNAEIARVVNEYAMAEFKYDPRMAAQRLLNYSGIPWEDRVPGDKNEFLRKHAPKELIEGVPMGMDRRSAEVVHYGKYALAGIDPGPLEEFVGEMDKDGLHGFGAIFNEMYGRLRWMVEDYLPFGNRLSTEEREKSEKVRREESIVRAWECERYRQMRSHVTDLERKNQGIPPKNTRMNSRPKMPK